MPVGHFCANHNKAVREGYKKTRDEAQAKCTEMLERGIEGEDAAEVVSQVEDMVSQGAVLVAGGKRRGAFVEPTVIDCPKDLPAAKDLEIFGPVWTVIGFDTDEEAIEIANQSVYGLNGGVIAGSVEHGLKIAQHIESGTVVANGEGSFRDPRHPFGGYKHSGLGREGIPDLMREFTQRKTLVVRGIN